MAYLLAAYGSASASQSTKQPLAAPKSVVRGEPPSAASETGGRGTRVRKSLWDVDPIYLYPTRIAQYFSPVHGIQSGTKPSGHSVGAIVRPKNGGSKGPVNHGRGGCVTR